MPMTARRSSRAVAREREEQQKQLRVGGRHCPVCLELLPRLGGRPARRCGFCGAQPAIGRRCASCHAEQVWEGDREAACAACGHHGSKVTVFAGREWLKEP
jgi:hypothetical protein